MKYQDSELSIYIPIVTPVLLAVITIITLSYHIETIYAVMWGFVVGVGITWIFALTFPKKPKPLNKQQDR